MLLPMDFPPCLLSLSLNRVISVLPSRMPRYLLGRLHQVTFFFIYPLSHPSESLDTFEKIARRMRAKATFYVSPGDVAYSSLLISDTSKPCLVAVKDFGREQYTYDTSFGLGDFDAVKDFVEKYRHPLVFDMSSENADV